MYNKNMMTKTQATATGTEMGKQAFARGCMRAPAMDAALQPVLAPLSFGIDDPQMARKSALSKALMTGWLRGWDRASLASAIG